MWGCLFSFRQLTQLHFLPLSPKAAETTQLLGPSNLRLSWCVLRLIFRAPESQEGKGYAEIIISDRPDFTVS